MHRDVACCIARTPSNDARISHPTFLARQTWWKEHAAVHRTVHHFNHFIMATMTETPTFGIFDDHDLIMTNLRAKRFFK